MIRRSLRLLVLGLTITQLSTVVFAQQAPSPGIGLLTGGRTFVGAPGDYGIRTEDLTALVGRLLDAANVRQKEDRDYLLNSVRLLQADYEALVTLVKFGKLLKISQESFGVKDVPVELPEFFAAINEVNEKLAQARGRITSLTSFNMSSLPSQIKFDDGKMKQTVDNFGQINWGPVAEPFRERIAALEKEASNFGVKVLISKTGLPQIIKPGEGSTLAPKFKIPPIHASELAKYRARIDEKRSPKAEVQNAALNLHLLLREMIREYIFTWGLTQGGRVRDDSKLLEHYGKGKKTKLEGIDVEDHFNARDTAFNQILLVSWQLSYLRLKHGVQVGTLNPADYVQRKGNIDKFLVMTETLTKFKEGMAIKKPDLMRAASNIRMILKVLDERSSEIVGEQSHPSLLVKANSFATFIGMRRPMAETTFNIMQVVAGGIKEETLLAESKISELREFYRRRYQSTEENAKSYFKMKCQTDPDMKHDEACAEVNSGAFAFGPTVNSSGGLGEFNILNGALQTMGADLEEADQIEAELRVAQMSNATAQRALSRAREL